MIFNSAYVRGDYDQLYANYLDESHGLLGETARTVRGEMDVKVAVDLCAGTGAMTSHLVALQIPRIYAVDNSRALLSALRRKIKSLGATQSEVTTISMDLNRLGALTWLRSEIDTGQALWVDPFAKGIADLITCRQAVGYLSHNTLVRIPELLTPGGRFIFNTFVEPTQGQVWFRRHSGGIAEAGLYAFGQVFHLQAKWPRVDATVFTWHDVEGVLKPLWKKAGYTTTVTRHGRTLIVEVQK